MIIYIRKFANYFISIAVIKKAFIIFSLLILTSHVKSQTIVDTTKLWNVATCSGGPFGFECETISYKFHTDTTINLSQYKILLETKDSSLSNWWSEGALREIGSKVYYYNFSNQTEYLLYDFGANVGDTIKAISFCENYLIVDSVDIVMIDGHAKRRLIFDFPSCVYTEEWIEGIGSNHGIVNSFSVFGFLPFDFGEDLLCYWEASQVKWVNPAYNQCYYITTQVQEQNKYHKISVFPNPFKDFAKVELNTINNNWSWELYNSMGQLVQRKFNLSGSALELNRGDLPAGIYFYQVRVVDSAKLSGKLLIE